MKSISTPNVPIYSQEHHKRAASPIGVRIFVATTLFGVIAVSVGFIGYSLQTEPRETLALRTKGAIVAVTVGPEPLVLGTRGHKLLCRSNPWLAERFGAVILRSTRAMPGNLVVWQHVGKAGFWSGPSPMLGLETSDVLGDTMHEVARGDLLSAVGEWVFPFALARFPRRGREVRITAREFGNDGESVTVRNPLPGNYPRWQPAPKDRIAKANGLLAALRDFRFVDSPNEYPVQIRISLDGEDAADWQAEKLEITDATGNVIVATADAHQFQSEIKSGTLQITMSEPIESKETAFKVSVTLARIGSIPDEETAVLTRLPIPKDYELLTESRRAVIHSSTIEVTHEIGTDAPHDLGWSSSGQEFALWLRNPQPDRALRVRYSGDQTWECPHNPAYTGCYSINMPDASPGERVDLHVALTRLHTFEFLAAPTRRQPKR